MRCFSKVSKPDYEEQCFCMRVGEFSVYTEIAFDEHLKRLINHYRQAFRIDGHYIKNDYENLWYGGGFRMDSIK